MTHSTVDSERESGGSTETLYHTIDITSLDSAGVENYDPSTEAGVDVDSTGGVDIVGQADATYFVRWDHVNGQLTVKEVNDTGDGTGGLADVASGTAVGEVRLRVEGI
jgi:hypothetical protein